MDVLFRRWGIVVPEMAIEKMGQGSWRKHHSNNKRNKSTGKETTHCNLKCVLFKNIWEDLAEIVPPCSHFISLFQSPGRMTCEMIPDNSLKLETHRNKQCDQKLF